MGLSLLMLAPYAARIFNYVGDTALCGWVSLTLKLADEIIMTALVLIHSFWLSINILELSLLPSRSQNRLSLFVKAPPVSNGTKTVILSSRQQSGFTNLRARHRVGDMYPMESQICLFLMGSTYG